MHKNLLFLRPYALPQRASPAQEHLFIESCETAKVSPYENEQHSLETVCISRDQTLKSQGSHKMSASCIHSLHLEEGKV